MKVISKQDYLYNKIVGRINKIVGNEHGKNNRLKYYKENKHRLDDLCLVDIHNFCFEREVKMYQDKYDELNKVDKLERHSYAPELNKIWFKDGTFKSVPGCDTIYKAIGL